MGADEGLDIIEQMENVEALAVTMDKKIHTTKGFDSVISDK